MKRFILFAATLSATTLLSSCVFQRPASAQRTVTVQASGKVEIENSRAVVSLSVTAKNPDSAKAVEENAEKTQKILQALSDAGIAKNYISTSSYRMYVEKNQPQGKILRDVYTVTNRLNVAVSDISQAGTVIDAAAKAGATGFDGIRFSAGSTDEAAKEARILAVKNAEKKALSLVTASGASLGKVLSITELSESDYDKNENAMMMTAAKAISTQVLSDATIVDVAVEVVYEIE